MEQRAEAELLLRELALRVAALEDSVAFLEVWCEEQQDALDRVECWYYEDDEPAAVHLRVVDIRDEEEPAPETDHERRVRQLRTRISHLRHELIAHHSAGDGEGIGAAAGSGADPWGVTTG